MPIVNDLGHVFELSDHGLPSIIHNGQLRVLAALPPRPTFGAFPEFSDKVPLIPRNKWFECDYWHSFEHIYDQGQFGSCVGHASVAALCRSRGLSGATNQILSATYVYAHINGGVDRGAIISDALDFLQSNGTCLYESMPSDRIYLQQIPKGADQVAPRFRIDKAYHASTFDEIGSGLLLGYIPVYGIYASQSFSDLDRYGIAPAFPNMVGNHALHGTGLKNVNGQWAILTPNSWDVSFGFDGCCYLTENHFITPNMDAFLIQTVEIDPEDSNVPNLV